VVIDGRTSVDESMLTGESMPLARGVGEMVCGGTLNIDGAVDVSAERIGRDTAAARVASLMRDTLASRAPISRTADRIAAVFVPAILALAAATGVIWAFAAPEGQAFALAPVAVLSTLVVACPCALGLAVPTAIAAGAGRASRAGVLVRDAASFERAASVRTVIFDKTGTLTAGEPELERVVGFGVWVGRERELHGVAATVERGSEHPVARAIVRGDPGTEWSAADFIAHPGLGASARVSGPGLSGVEVRVGAESWALGAEGAAAEGSHHGMAHSLRDEGCTVVWVSVDGQTAGLIAVRDALRPGSADAVRALRAMGIGVALLTGDAKQTAVLARRRPARLMRCVHVPQRGRWQWSATASTTRPRLRPPTLASRWVLARMWHATQPRSPSCAPTRVLWLTRLASRAARCG